MRNAKKLFLMGLLLPGLAGYAAPRPAPPPATVVVEPVKRITKSAPKEYIGNEVATDKVDIPSRISGFITGIKFKEGSLVKKGDLLFTIEDTTYRAKVQAAKAKLNQVNAELKYAQSNFDRQKKLANKNAVSQSNFEDAKRLVEYNKAKYDEYKADLLDAENNLSYTKIYAPITGRIGKVQHTIGNYVSPSSTALATIVSVDPIQVKFAVSERDYLNLFKNADEPNANLDISIKLANGKLYGSRGKIAFIDNMVDSDTGTIAIWVDFPNPDMKLQPGGYVTVLLSELLSDKLLGVKLTAALTDKKGNYVFVVDKDNKVQRRDVELGDVVEDQNIVKKGLKADDLVIVDGTHKVRPGDTVKPVRPGEFAKKTGKVNK